MADAATLSEVVEMGWRLAKCLDSVRVELRGVQGLWCGFARHHDMIASPRPPDTRVAANGPNRECLKCEDNMSLVLLLCLFQGTDVRK